jgi:hypothetical protein
VDAAGGLASADATSVGVERSKMPSADGKNESLGAGQLKKLSPVAARQRSFRRENTEMRQHVAHTAAA